MIRRRELYVNGTRVLSGLIALVLAIPGVAYLLAPAFPRHRRPNGFRRLARLSELTEGVPRWYAVIDERQDAWVRYPPEPIGAVWLVRQPKGSRTPVVAYTAECPHLGCAVGLAPDGRSFLCPCHDSSFTFEGERRNTIPPREMDRLEVRLSTDPDPEVRVRFQRFRTMSKEKIPLV